MIRRRLAVALAPVLLVCAGAPAQSGSLLVEAVRDAPAQSPNGVPHMLLDRSLFALAPPEIRVFKKHDLVTIIVRETSRAKSKQELDAGKDYDIGGAVGQLADFAGPIAELPEFQLEAMKDFIGRAKYKREDDLTARLTAEVIDILPNGNLILEARTEIMTDEEQQVIRLTGICRPDDVDPSNAIVSSRLHDLKIHKLHRGELAKANEKGIIAKILDTIFAF